MQRIGLAIAGAVLGLLLAEAIRSQLFLFPAIGGVCGYLVAGSSEDHKAGKGAVVLLLCAHLAAAAVCLAAAGNFYGNWYRIPKLTALLTRFPGSPALLLKLAAGGLAVLAYWFVYRICLKAVLILKQAATVFRWKLFFSELFGGKWLRKLFAWCLQGGLDLLAAVLLGTLLLTAVYAIPAASLSPQVRRSAAVIRQEGTYPELVSWAHSRLDNFTDAIMLGEAAYDGKGTPLENAMLVYRGTMGEANPDEVLAAHFLDDRAYTGADSYVRYWHGYLVFLKPLLLITDYNGIRWINGVLQLLLVAGVALLLLRRKLGAFVPAWLVCWGLLMPAALAKSLQFSACFYVLALGTAALLSRSSYGSRSQARLFMQLGLATAFLDLLTYPMAAFGVPAVVAVLLQKKQTVEKKLASLVRNGLAWCLGFGGMWIAKWAAATVLTGQNAFADALGAVLTRTSHEVAGGEKVALLAVELKNYTSFFRTPVLLLLVLLVLYLANRRRKTVGGGVSIQTLPFAVLALVPILWYAFAANHSMIHYWFTDKACVVSAAALLGALVDRPAPREPAAADTNTDL